MTFYKWTNKGLICSTQKSNACRGDQKISRTTKNTFFFVIPVKPCLPINRSIRVGLKLDWGLVEVNVKHW